MKKMKKAALAAIMLAACITTSFLAATTSQAAEAEKTKEEKLAPLANKTAGVLTGTPQDSIVEANVEGATLEYFNNASDMQLALESNKIDFFVLSTINYFGMADQYPDFAYIDQPLTSFDIGAIFPMNEDGDALRQQYNQYLAQLKENGELERLNTFWLIDQDKEEIEIPTTGENGVLHMATANTQIPFSYMYNEKNVGFDIAVAAGFCKEYGYGLDIENVEFAGAISGIAAGKYDFAASQIAYTEERAESVYYSDFYTSQEIVAIVKAENFQDADLAVKDQDATKESNGILASIKKTLVDENRWMQILKGLEVTLIITFAGFILANILGALVCAMAMSDSKILKFIAGLYSGLMQGLPIVVILMILYYVIFGHSRISNVLVAVVGFGFIFGAYMAQLFEGAIRSVDKGQWEAALAIGFTKRETFNGIILPQAIRTMVRGYFSQLISLMKGTAVVGYIAITDLTKVGDIIRSNTYEAIVPLVTIALIYLVMAALMIFIMHLISQALLPKRLRDKAKVNNKREGK